MAPFYQELKSLREQQGIDLAEIHNRTKINIQFLEAIESGQFNVLPTPYIRLFLRAYVTEIGGNAEEALTQLEHHLSGAQEKRIPVQKTQKTDEKLEAPTEDILKPIPPKPANKLRSNLIKGGVLLIVWVFALIIIRKITLVPDDSAPGGPALINGMEIISEEQLLSDFTLLKSQDKILEAQPPFSFKIVCTRPLGFLTKRDTLAAVPISLPAGNQKTYEFKDRLDILLNHTRGVSVYLNGETLKDIDSQSFPVRISLIVEPPRITIRHFTPIN